MNAVFQIQGRNAIPVRAISFLTNWTVLTPADLVEALSKSGGAGEIRQLTAYRLDGANVKAINQSWWAEKAMEIESLTATLKVMNGEYREWKIKTIQALPKHGFVWQDELEAYFNQFFLDDDGATCEYFVDRNHVILGLDWEPFDDGDMELVVMDGFQNNRLEALLAIQHESESIDSAGAQSVATPVPMEKIEYSLLATPDELLGAFVQWGLKEAWFGDLNSRKWLLNARRIKGQGQKGQVIKPLFCPYAVMNGLIGKVRKANRLQPDTAWRTLQHKFPKVYATFESHDPRGLSGD